MPNSFAYIALFSWPFVVLWMLLRYPANRAIFIALVLSGLLLPTSLNMDLPLIPPLNRETITSLSLVLILFLLGRKLRVFQSGIIIKILIGYLAVTVISAQLNAASIVIGGKFLPGITLYDVFSDVVRILLWIIPFFLGRYFANNVKDIEIFFKILVIMGLVYSLPMLYEVRMSPQLHNLVYGYHASDFVQSVRGGDSFRPAVFVGHGLALAFWFSTCIVAAIALHKNKMRVAKFSPWMIVCYLSAILFLSKTWSALFYVILGVIFIYKLSPSKQIKWSFLMAALIMLYPVTKIMGVFPDKEIISSIREYNAERADSMETRFINEEVLLARALEKPFFGWGGWGRNRVYDNTGKDIVITDGNWIIQFGINGGLGFLFYYAILLTPLYYARKNVRYIDESKDQVYFAALALILAISIIDSVPNTGMMPIHLFLAGALLGQSEFLRKQKYLKDSEKNEGIY